MAFDWKQLSASLATGGALRRAPPVVTGVIMFLLALSAARVTWMVFPPPVDEAAVPLTEPQTPSPITRKDPLMTSREIATRHLFGAPLPDNAAAADQPIPETQLNLLLRGVAASNNTAAAFAIIADPAGKEDFYQVGDQLPGGAVLKEVHPQHIILSRGDRFETLRLPQQSLELNAPAQPMTMPPVTAPMPSAVAPDAGGSLQQLREQFVQDPQVMANLLQGEPFRDGGRLVGYRIRPGRDTALFTKFGLQAGDVVTAVNGVSVTDPQGRLDLMRSIGAVEEVTVDLLRNGTPQSMTIQMTP